MKQTDFAELADMAVVKLRHVIELYENLAIRTKNISLIRPHIERAKEFAEYVQRQTRKDVLGGAKTCGKGRRSSQGEKSSPGAKRKK